MTMKKLKYDELLKIMGETGMKLLTLEKAYHQYRAETSAEIMSLKRRVIEAEKMADKLNFLMEHDRNEFVITQRKMSEVATVSKFNIKYIQGRELKAFEFTVKELVTFCSRSSISDDVDILCFAREDGEKIYYQLARNTKVLTVITDIYNKKIAKTGGKK